MDFFDDGDFSEYADDARKAVARRFGRSKASSSGSQKPAAPAAPGGGGGGLAAMMQGMAGGGGGAKMQPAMTAMAGGGDIKKAVSSAGFARTLKKAQGALRSASIGVARSLASLYIYIIVLLLLFIVHQAITRHFEHPKRARARRFDGAFRARCWLAGMATTPARC